jgi:hypothetical protein
VTPTHALAELRAHPSSWLARHHITAYSGVPATFGGQAFHFGNTGYIDVLGVVGPKNEPVYDRTAGSQRAFGLFGGKGARSFAFSPQAGVGAGFVGNTVLTQAGNIPVVASGSLNGTYTGIALNDLATVAEDFAITTMLNGCTYLIDGANPGVAHIQPTGGMKSGALRNHLAGNYAVVYGGGNNEYDDQTEDVAVIGVRKNGSWKIYAQVHALGARNVKRVEKLFG